MSLLLSGDLKLSKPTTSSVLITPQTKVPVDPLIGDVSLLLHGDGTNGKQNNTFLDSSTNNFTITRNGNATQGSFSPFGKVGGSGYFDGSGDSLTATAGTAFAYGTGDFTVEGWFYGTAPLPNYGPTLYAQTVSGTNYFWINASNGGFTPTRRVCFNFGTSGAGTQVINDATEWQPNTWNHFAVVRSSGSARVYLNGVGGTAVSCTQDFSNTTYVPTVGRYTHSDLNNFTGYISNLRILKGTALYTANFTPPTAPLTAITNTSLLLNFTNAGIVDSAARNNLETVGNAQVSTAQSKFGGSSIAFDGNGDYLLSVTRSEYDLPGDFTIECWVRQNSTAGIQGIIVKRRLDFTEAGSWGIGTNAGTFMFQNLRPSTNTNTNFGTSTANTWQHVAVSRQGSSIRMFLNGTLNATITDSTDFTNQRPLVIGAWDRGGAGDVPTQNWFNGYIDDLRITKGIARYTTNFTPPTAPFPDI